MTGKCLVACIGNIFFADDGFGVEVARRLAASELPDGVSVVDYGIRGVHLAYDLLAGYDLVILVDAIDRGDAPGTVSVLDVTAAGAHLVEHPRQLDPHGMAPDAVLEHVAQLGGAPRQVYVVGCQPHDTSENIGLSTPVAAAVTTAARAVVELVGTHYPVVSTTGASDPVVSTTGASHPTAPSSGAATQQEV
jgi:hydrogenase maturation protease